MVIWIKSRILASMAGLIKNIELLVAELFIHWILIIHRTGETHCFRMRCMTYSLGKRAKRGYRRFTDKYDTCFG